MYGWTQEERIAALEFRTKQSLDAGQLFAKARAMIAAPETADIGSLLRAYSNGVGTFSDVAAWRLRQLANELGEVCGLVSADQGFFTRGWSLNPEAVEQFCPEVLPSLMAERSNEDVQQTEIFEWSPNEIMDPSWPPGIAGSIRRARRLPFRSYSTDDAAVYVDPYRYQIMSSDLSAMWETGSPRGLTKACFTESAPTNVAGDLVIIQDRFDFGNFCHFLYDAVTRVFHFINRFGFGHETFIFGGIPGKYHQLLGQALSDAAGVPVANLHFPKNGTILRPSGKCIWFSDQKELHSHPAQMAHPASIAALAKIADHLPNFRSGIKHAYVSRKDADRRRIVNEPELTKALESHGFKAVELSKLSIEEQIGLFQNAETIVGPHGMGLTNIALGKNIGRVVELFHPTAGTDAYALIAKTSGINYHYALGNDIVNTPSDASVNIDQIVNLSTSPDIYPRRVNFRRALNLIPASRTFFGFIVRSPEPGVVWPGSNFDRMIADQETCVHWKIGPPLNTNVGEWRNIDVIPAARYTASCWVWLPGNFSGDEVSIRFEGKPEIKYKFADLSRREVWQRLHFSALISDDCRKISVGLHIEGNSGAGVVSTCWQFERAAAPHGYVSTG